MGDACCQCRGFAGTGGSENTEVLMGRLSDNAGLFVIECDSAFAEFEAIFVGTKITNQSASTLKTVIVSTNITNQSARTLKAIFVGTNITRCASTLKTVIVSTNITRCASTLEAIFVGTGISRAVHSLYCAAPA
jgi:hypothetical protein